MFFWRGGGVKYSADKIAEEYISQHMGYLVDNFIRLNHDLKLIIRIINTSEVG